MKAQDAGIVSVVTKLMLYDIFIEMSIPETDQSEGEETEDSGIVTMVKELMQYNTEEDYMVKEEDENLDGKHSLTFFLIYKYRKIC